jgi:hypothetical protein
VNCLKKIDELISKSSNEEIRELNDIKKEIIGLIDQRSISIKAKLNKNMAVKSQLNNQLKLEPNRPPNNPQDFSGFKFSRF